MALDKQQLKNVPIYRYGRDKEIFFDDIVDVLRKCGLERGDTVIIHVDLGAFGKLGNVTSRKDFVDIFVGAFQEVIGEEGTLISPTFSYSFCKGEVYDPDNTPSVIGPFAEEFRLRHDACRSINPIFSVAAIGKRAKELTSHLSKSCFGIGSVYDKLHQTENSKYVVVGVNYFICTQVHYVEELIQVPYRYLKKFKGKINLKGRVYEDEYEFYVRYLDKEVNTTFDKIERHLLDHGLMKKVPLGGSFISCVGVRDIYHEGVTLLKKDPNIFLANESSYNKTSNG